MSEVKRMREMFETGRLSRRHFMQGLLAARLTTGTAAAVITGSRDVQASTPKRGGLIRMAAAQHGPDDSLDPAALEGDPGLYARPARTTTASSSSTTT